ncbi:MAG: bifunctional diaminohydroxyphosphoribosylaminopyrimidine deaminase/5-amino-6-(5-phosphoribosylamino)uracil reductase RibD [Pseudomonadota bacterium]
MMTQRDREQDLDAQLMSRALELAARGLYSAHPNPRVGCVLVKDARVIGEGWHHHPGTPHAEVMAIRSADEDTRGTTAYVTLEPCSHHGRTPPCVDALRNAGVAEVVAAVEDPNPLVSGRGFQTLRDANIEVRTGVLRDRAIRLNRGFFHRMRLGRPWFRVKLAMSIDARTALADGDSRWITGPSARADVQHWRARASAIFTGIGTVIADDPRLTVRDDELVVPPDYAQPGDQPYRIVLDSTLRLPNSAGLLDLPGNTYLISAEPGPNDDRTALDERRRALEHRGAVILTMPRQDDGRIDLGSVAGWLGRLEVNEVHTEAGPTLAGALWEAGLVDELLLYAAPTLLGADARPLIGWSSPESMHGRPALRFVDVRLIGDDLRLLLRPLE